jgi:hypothetical protein
MQAFRRRILFGFALMVAVRLAAAAPAERPATFETEFVVRSSTYGIMQQATLTTKGNLLRYQQRTGAGLKLLLIRNHRGAYHINLYSHDGAHWPASWAHMVDRRLVTGGPQGDPQRFFQVAHARRTGRARIDGRTAEVWTYSLPQPAGKAQVVRVFMDAKEKRPLRAEMRMPVAPGRMDTVVIDYHTYRWDFPLPDRFFDVPRGVKIVDL